MFGIAIGLMNRIGFAAKFAIIGGAGAVALCVAVAQYVNLKNAAIASTENEIAGVRYVGAVSRLVDGLQRHRGLSTTLLRGDTTVEARVAAAASDVEAALKAVSVEDVANGEVFGTSKGFKEISGNWAALRSGLRAAKPAENFAVHTMLIKQALAHGRLAADGSELTLDPEAPSYYLMEVFAFRMPMYGESAAKLRGSTAALVAKKDVSPEEAGAARQLIGEMEMTLEMAREGLAKAMLQAPAARAKLAANEESSPRCSERCSKARRT